MFEEKTRCVKGFFKVNQKLMYQRMFQIRGKVVERLYKIQNSYGKRMFAIFLVVKIVHADLCPFFLRQINVLTIGLVIFWFYADSWNSRIYRDMFFLRHRHNAKRRRSYRHIVQLKRYNGWNANYRYDLLARNA